MHHGYQYFYRALLEISGLKTFRERRENRCNKFASKCLRNNGLSFLFPANTNGLRHVRPFLEFQAKTVRLANSPVYDLRRRLNALHP